MTAVVKSERPATASPCADCPWRREHHGKRTHGEWYTKANLKRLWGGLKHGTPMTCHPTDPRVEHPHGKPAAAAGHTRLCAGALILVQRSLDAFGAACEAPEAGARNGLRVYRQRAKPGQPMSRDGLIAWSWMVSLGRTDLIGGVSLPRALDGQDDIGVPWEDAILNTPSARESEASR